MSSMYTNTRAWTSLMSSFMHLWKVPGDPFSPIGIRRYSKTPKNAVLEKSFSARLGFDGILPGSPAWCRMLVLRRGPVFRGCLGSRSGLAFVAADDQQRLVFSILKIKLDY
ncbi:unnamed protein product [Caenorhabditis nigoni]